MKQNQLFQQTRWRLASWYAGVMGGILSISGLGVYEAIAHAHWVTVDRELTSVAGTLHDSVETILKQPGKLETKLEQILPNICLVQTSCFNNKLNSERHLVGVLRQEDYYIIFLDSTGKLVASAGNVPDELFGQKHRLNYTITLQLIETKNIRYRQISLLLHTQDNRFWGYLQVGRSLQDFDDYLKAVRWIMLLGLPIAMIFVGVSSWCLAGLAMQPIYQFYQQIQQFTADAAHELRTPLAAIRATVESTLRMSKLSEIEARSTLEVIKRQNYRLSQLVGDLLLLSRMDRRGLPLQQNLENQVCLQDLVNDIAEELAPLAVAANLQLNRNIQIDEPVKVRGNEEQLYRMVANLLINAIHYTPADGKVTLILESCYSYVMIQVQDTGIGISIEEQKHIFERFYRVNSDRSRKSGGFGLGLPISMAIAEAHQGDIKVESELDKGSTFTIRLPISN
ncbi:MAG: two-component sensor histidine kinase [Moorea sp. SIO2B7]|nr:two-component sensor histidine kinase [Moorena sp. SIO2B7]